MLIVEGMDGSGKSGMVQRIADNLKIPIHERACKSKEGPIDLVYEWARRDVVSYRWQPFSVYDRHPLISEYIYGPITRQRVNDQFYSEQATKICELFAGQVLIVFCDPGVDEVLENIARTPGEHMDGVTTHASRIYYAYKTLMHYWPGNRPVVWDYTQPHTYDSVIQKCVEFMGIQNMEGVG